MICICPLRLSLCNRQECGRFAAFRCMDACAKLNDDLFDAEPLPANVTCLAQGTSPLQAPSNLQRSDACPNYLKPAAVTEVASVCIYTRRQFWFLLASWIPGPPHTLIDIASHLVLTSHLLGGCQISGSRLYFNTAGAQDASFFGAAASWLQGHGSGNLRYHLNNQQIQASRLMEEQVGRLWWSIRGAVELVEDQTVKLPEPRTHRMDWVRDGVRMPL